MPEMSGKSTTKVEPSTAWTVVTDAPLKGIAYAREAGRILAWDEGNQLYLLSVGGESLSFSRVPHRITAGAISDDGSLIALLGEGDDAPLLLLNADFDIDVERTAPSESSFLTIDPHGRYVALGNRLGAATLINRFGKPVGRIDTIQPIAHLCFIPDRPFLVGAATFGMLVGIEVEGSKGSGRLETEVAWQDRLMSNVGRLAVSGDGGMILASCFTHGIQRFDLRGRNEGSYHLGGTVSHAVPDFPGRTIAAATLEGEFAIMNSAGNVRWRTRLPRPVIVLEMDPLGRFVIQGFSAGEITRLDLFGTPANSERRPDPERVAANASGGKPAAMPRVSGTRTNAGSVRRPDWTIPAVQTEQQAETAVMAVTEGPESIILFTSPHKLQIFSELGEKRIQGPDMGGVGRILRSSPGWLAAATDRHVVLYDLRSGTQRRLDVSLVELTHLAIRPDTYGLALVQERDRIGRVTPAGRWIWKRELRAPVEDLAIGPQGYTAATGNEGRLMVFDPGGEMTLGAQSDPSDPPLLIEAPEDSPAEVVWITLERRAQTLSGHDLRGKVIWNRSLAWEGWTLNRLGKFALVASVDGRALAFDGAGSVRHEGAASGDPGDQFTIDRDGLPLRISRKGLHLICAGLDGRIRWRAVAEQPWGPFAVGPAGVAVLAGLSLAWFRAGVGEPTPTSDIL